MRLMLWKVNLDYRTPGYPSNSAATHGGTSMHHYTQPLSCLALGYVCRLVVPTYFHNASPEGTRLGRYNL